MIRIVPIVEGEGEVKAVPILLRRLWQWRTPDRAYPDIAKPLRAHRDQFVNKPDEFRRFVLLAAEKAGAGGWVLILLDADDDCPLGLAPRLLSQARAVAPHVRLSVVLANREYEAWFIASAPSLHGKRHFCFVGEPPTNAEVPRNAKGWISERLRDGRYHEQSDQPALTEGMDLDMALAGSRSFRKLVTEWDRHWS